MCNASRSVRCLGAMATALALLLCGGPVACSSSNKPAARAMERAMKYAPDGAVGLIHVEVKALVKDVLAAVQKGLEPNTVSEGVTQSVLRVGEKIDSVDCFIVPGPGGVPDTFFLVIHGTADAADLGKLILLIPEIPDGEPLKKLGGGRYRLFEKGPHAMSFEGPDLDLVTREVDIHLVVGGEAMELPRGIAVAGKPSMLAKESLAALGKGRNDRLVKVLQGVDANAPIWGALETDAPWATLLAYPTVREPETLKSASASVFVLGGGTSRVAMRSGEEHWAESLRKALQDDKGLGKFLLSSMVLKREGTVVSVVAPDSNSLVPLITAGIAEGRRLALRDSSLSNLSRIGSAISVYVSANRGLLPTDFRTLIKDGERGDIFISPKSGKPVPKVEKGEVVGPFDPDYVYLRYTDLDRAGAGLVLAYERPELNKNEGTNVLFTDLRVGWLDMKEFQELLKKSQDAIAAQEKAAKEK